jgi:isoquinoline 1-oxidoreductase beta subunit
VCEGGFAEGGRDPITFQGLNPGGTEGQLGYGVANLLIEHAMVNPPIPSWFWQYLGSGSPNARTLSLRERNLRTDV